MRWGVVALACVAACSKDSGAPAARSAPDSGASMWIAKLDDPAQRDRAITELERLCDPMSIPGLGEAWEKHGRPSRMLDAVIQVSRCAPDGGWPFALDTLRAAVLDHDPNDPRALDDAIKAAEALREARLRGSAQILVAAVTKPIDPADPAQRLRVTAIRSLGTHGHEQTLEPLAAIVRADAGANPAAAVTAAIAAIGEMASDSMLTSKAIAVLVEAMYGKPMYFQQVQRALVAIGPVVRSTMRDILRREYPAAQPFAADPAFNPLDYYASIVLGNLYDQDAIHDLLAALERPVVPAFADEAGLEAPPAQHGVLSALRKLGSPKAADEVLALFARSTDVSLRASAATTYGLTSTSGQEMHDGKSGLALLGERVADRSEPEEVRLAGAEAYARLASSLDDAKLLQTLAGNAKVHPGYQRWFEHHVGRIEVAVRCAGKAPCLVATLKATPDDAFAAVSPHLTDLDWTAAEKAALRSAQIDRAMIELRRQGSAASAHTDELLAAINDPAFQSDPVVRQAILLALTAIAPLPCTACVTELDKLAAAGEGKTELNSLTHDTRLVSAYFRWAGT